MMPNHRGFSLSFEVPIEFTTGVFEAANPTLLECITRLEPQRCHRLLVVIDRGVLAGRPELVREVSSYVDAHEPVLTMAAPPVVVEGGEAAKQGLGPATSLVSLFSDAGIDRQSFIVVIGGGAVLDMVCFAAALTHRGVRTIRLPTTTLSQGDSGVGVKNGVNLFGKKNFAGTFVPPFAVINDSEFLLTLGRRDRRCGLAEAVKVAILRDVEFFEWLEANARRLDEGEPALLAHAVRRSAELHADHICGSGDPFELGSARPLDFGHWSAHKLESLTGHMLRHGEAVAIGIALDLRYSVRIGLLAADTADRILAVYEAMGFTLFDDALLHQSESGELSVLKGLREFREHLGGELHVTLLRSIGQRLEVHEMDADVVVQAIHDLAARSARVQGLAKADA